MQFAEHVYKKLNIVCVHVSARIKYSLRTHHT